MRFYQPLPHAASIPAVCVLLCLGALCLQGCGPDDASSKKSESERLYAELDERFPEGRPGVTSGAKRMEDADYLKNLEASGSERVRLANEVAAAEQEVRRFRTAFAQGMKTPEGALPDDAALDAALANHAHYQKLLADLNAAQAKSTEQQKRVRATIRERMFREQKEYDTLKAQADAAAKAEGQLVRVAQSSATPAPQPKAAPAAAKAVTAEQPTSPTPTAKDLAEQLNKPLVETAK